MSMFVALSLSAIMIMVFVYKKSIIENKTSLSDNHIRPMPLSSIQWDAREIIMSIILEESGLRLKKWADENRQNYRTIDIMKEFETRINSFREDIHLRSYIDIPPYFASILSVDKLQEIIDSKKDILENAGVAVMMGASVLYAPPYRTLNIVVEDKNTEI